MTIRADRCPGREPLRGVYPEGLRRSGRPVPSGSLSRLTHVLAARARRVIGGRADTGEAALAVALSESIPYQDITAEARTARERLADAERRAAILRERCRLHRAAVAVALGSDGKEW